LAKRFLEAGKKVLITGSSGFLGKALWQYLKKYGPGLRIYGLTRKRGSRDHDVFVCDFKNKRRVGLILEAIKPDYIFHCAGGRMAERKALREANVVTTKCLLEAIRGMKRDWPRVIIPGSAAEYGKMPSGRRKIHESYRCVPLSVYGAVKLEQTSAALASARQGMDVVVARIFNTMGERTPPALAAGRFAEQIARIEKGLSKAVIETKNLTGKRDFLDIGDVCSALWAVARYGKSRQVYNVCSGRPVTVKKVLRKLLSLSKIRDIAVNEHKDDTSSSFDVIGSNAKLRSLSGWSAQVAMERSLKDTLDSYRGDRARG